MLMTQPSKQWIFLMAFSCISIRTPPRCHINVGLFTLTVILVIFFVVSNYNSSPRPPVKSLAAQSTLRYNRLQPLREMFANASKVKVKVKEQRSNTVGSTVQRKLNVTDLQEVQNKVYVLLLLIVTTAPSRYDRREAIRQTWWKKCDGVEVSWKQLQINSYVSLWFTEMRFPLWNL